MDIFLPLRIIFIPDNNLIKTALKTAKKISIGKKTIFSIDNKNYYAHLTIYMAEFPNHNTAKILRILSNTAKLLTRVNLSFEKIYFGDGYIGLGFKRTKEIIKTHKKILEALNPLREGHLREKYYQEIKEKKFTFNEIKYIQKYGYHNVLNNYHPHLTLARFSTAHEDQTASTQLDRELNIPEAYISGIAVAETGPNGTVTKVIKAFPLVHNSHAPVHGS